MTQANLLARTTSLLAAYRAKGLKIATAESCTGGLIAGALTEVAGSSDVFERGFVTYSNEAKNTCLGVPMELIMEQGAVSDEVARAMAQGTLAHSLADVAVSVTGVAGPGGGSESKPVGLVFLGTCARGQAPRGYRFLFQGDRQAIRAAALDKALSLLEGQLL